MFWDGLSDINVIFDRSEHGRLGQEKGDHMVQTTDAQGKEHPTGYDVLRNPRLNRGTAFTEEERRKYRLEGLLPPAVTNMELQAARRHAVDLGVGPDPLAGVPVAGGRGRAGIRTASGGR